MPSSRKPWSPVIGLLVAGATLILILGVVELIAIGSVALTISLAPSAPTFAVSGITVALAVLVYLLAWRYAADPTFFQGVGMILVGALSFFVGAGFIVGGIMIIIAGAVAVFGVEVEDRFGRLEPGRNDVRGPESVGRAPEIGALTASSEPGLSGYKSASAGVVVYHPCPSCGELIRGETPRCPQCGRLVE